MLKRILLSLSLLLPLVSQADPLSQDKVPEPLKPWVEWVLQDTQQLDCPYQYNQAQRRCSWPSQLQLLLSDNGGTFSQQWQVYEEMLIRLPGDGDYWPQNVQSDQGELLVQSVKGVPYVKLSAGTHRVRGLFRWSKLPKSLPVAPESDPPCPASMTILILSLLLVVLGFVVVVVVVMLPVVLFELLCVVPEI